MQPAFDHCFFDLDGTLTDSEPGILNGVEKALAHFGISVPRQSLNFFIGPPLLESFGTYFPDEPEKAHTALRIYRAYYAEQGMYENRVYDGIADLLRDLRQAGIAVHMATAKPENFARTIVAHFGLAPLLSVQAGAELDGPRHDKTDVLRYAVELAGVTDMSRCLMIGDRNHDVHGAHAAGMACTGVLYGYGSREELQAAGADYLCEDIPALRRLLLPAPKAGSR